MFRKIRDSNKPLPKCPYCESRIEKPEKYSIAYREEMYACPHCLKVLGFSKNVK